MGLLSALSPQGALSRGFQVQLKPRPSPLLKKSLLPLRVPQQNNDVSVKDSILSDQEGRIADEFKVTDKLKPRVAFWFDIYSKYGSTEHVIHHVNYPWVIYNVVDVKPILESKGNRWALYHKAQRYVQNEKKKIRRVLLSLSKKRSYKRLSPVEKKYYELLAVVPGRRRTVFRQAASHLRAQLGQKDFIIKGLQSSNKYLPHIEDVFSKMDLPLEVTRLPLVESSFNEAAFSKVGASGVWQIMPSIGKKFLTLNSAVDERNSPIKATTAAAQLLRQNYRILKSWPLALTAYNHGPGGLLRATKKVGTKDISVIIEKYHSRSFGFASSNFYTSFLAALHVEKYQKEIFGELTKHEPLEIAQVTLTSSIKINDLVKALNIPAENLRALNLDIKRNTWKRNRRLPRGYKVIVPQELSTKLEAYLDTYPTSISESRTKREVAL